MSPHFRIHYVIPVLLTTLIGCTHKYSGPSLTKLHTKNIQGERTWQRKVALDNVTDTSYYLTDTAFLIVMLNDKQLQVGTQKFNYIGSYYKTTYYHVFNVDTTEELRYIGYERPHGDSYISYYYKEGKITIHESDGGNGYTETLEYLAK